MGVARYDALEPAIVGVVGLEAILVADAGLHEPVVGEATAPAELVPLEEEQVIAPSELHRASGLDLQLNLVRAVVGTFVFHGRSDGDAETVAAREIEHRRQRHERLVVRFPGKRGAVEKERRDTQQGTGKQRVSVSHGRTSDVKTCPPLHFESCGMALEDDAKFARATCHQPMNERSAR